MLLAKKRIPFESIDLFTARLLVKARETDICAAMAYSVGNLVLRDVYNSISAHLYTVAGNGIGKSTALSYVAGNQTLNTEVNSIITKARVDGSQPAMSLSTRLNNPNSSDFNLTAEQITKCFNEATDQALAEGLDDRNELAFNQRVQEIAGECQDKAIIGNIVFGRLEDANVAMLYALMDDQTVSYKNAVNNKRGEQKLWIRETTKVTGLPEDIIRGIIRNGICNVLGKDPDMVQILLANSLKKPGTTIDSQNALNSPLNVLDPATITLIANIITAVIGAVSASVLFAQNMKQLRTDAYKAIPDPDLFAPAAKDFDNNGVDDDKQTFFQTATAPNMLGLIGSLAVGIIPQIVFPKNNTVRIIAGVIGGGGTIYFGNNIINPIERWIVGDKSLTAEELKAIGYIEYKGEWYKAQKVAEESNVSIGDLISGGKDLYDSISNVFDTIKDGFGGDTDFFVGNPSPVDPGDA